MIWSVIRWGLVMLVNLLGFLTAPIIFPLAYLLRDIPIFRDKILWFYYDDEDGYFGADWWHIGKKLNFWTAYRWSFRNPAWNLQASLKPKNGLKEYVKSKGLHSQNGNYDISVFDMCVLKWLNENQEYSNNQGEVLSYVYSIIGKMLVWYEIDDTLYWRYSYADKLFWRIWCELHLGTTDTRYTFRLKIKWL